MAEAKLKQQEKWHITIKFIGGKEGRKTIFRRKIDILHYLPTLARIEQNRGREQSQSAEIWDNS